MGAVGWRRPIQMAQVFYSRLPRRLVFPRMGRGPCDTELVRRVRRSSDIRLESFKSSGESCWESQTLARSAWTSAGVWGERQ
jgi:hypothetical protein